MRLIQNLKSAQHLALCNFTTWLIVLAESILIMTSDASTQLAYLEPLRIYGIFANMLFFTIFLVLLGHPAQLNPQPRSKRCMEVVWIIFLANWTFLNLEISLRWQRVHNPTDTHQLFRILVQMIKQLLAYWLPACYYFTRCQLYSIDIGSSVILVLFWSLSSVILAFRSGNQSGNTQKYLTVKQEKSLRLGQPQNEKQSSLLLQERLSLVPEINSRSELKNQKLNSQPSKKIKDTDLQESKHNPKKLPKEIILDKLPDGIAILNGDGKFEYINSSFAKILNCSQEQAIEKLLLLPNNAAAESPKRKMSKLMRKSDTTIPTRGKNSLTSLSFVDYDVKKMTIPNPETKKNTFTREFHIHHDEKPESKIDFSLRESVRILKTKPFQKQSTAAKRQFFQMASHKSVKESNTEKHKSLAAIDDEEQLKFYQEKFDKYFEDIFNDGLESDSRDVRDTIDQVLRLLIDLRDSIFDSYQELNNISPNDIKIKMRYSATGVSRRDRFFRKFTIRSSFAVRVESAIKLENNKERFLDILINPILVEGEAFLVIQLRDVSDREMVKQLKEINREQNSSLAKITHEFRSPLGGVLSMLEGLAPQISHHLREKYLQPALTSASVLLYLVNDILDLHQMQAKELRLVFTDCNLTEICENSLNIIKFKADKRGIALETNISAEIPKIIHTDPNRLQQILVNLLSNAIKFTEHGKISIEASYLPQKKIKLQVSDTGIGIEKENLEKLFKSFGKIDLGRNNDLNPQGAGLGLYISNGLAKRLNFTKGEGGLAVSSRVDEGTCFSFIIDNLTVESENVIFIEDDETTHVGKMMKSLNNTSSFVIHKDGKNDESELSIISKPSAPTKKINTAKTSTSIKACNCTKILVVDDDEINLWALKTQLESLHLTKVDSAKNGEEAVQKFIDKHTKKTTCCTGCYTLILIDCEMPIKNGIVATKEIRDYAKEKCFAQKPTIIGVSGFSTPDISRKCLEAGMDSVITKPVPKKTLKTIVMSLNLI